MLTGTHIKLANYIHYIFKKKYGIRLNKKHLIYGSIKPDFTKNKVPHYIDKSIDYIDKEIEKIINDNNSENKKAFSRRLGMIMHYISDYFCRAHNTDYYRKNLVAHLKYEKRLAKAIKMKDIKKKRYHEMNFGKIKELVVELNKEYMKEKSLIRDKEYTIRAINGVCGYIAQNILNMENEKVA